MLRNRGTTTLPTSDSAGLNYGGGDAYAGSSSRTGQRSSSGGSYYHSYGGYSGSGSNGSGSGFGYSNGGYTAAGMAAAATAAPVTNSKARRRSSSSTSGIASGALSVVVVGAVCVFFFVTTFYYRSIAVGVLSGLDVTSKADAVELVERLKRDVDKYRNQSKDQKRAAHDRYSSQITNLQDEKRRLQKERDEFRAKHLDGHGAREELESEIKRLQGREDAFLSQLQTLQEATRKESRRSVLERFGPAPHKVEMQFVLPHDENARRYRIVIEMAPLDLVPHAVHLFMEQVAHGLWDHTYMYLNGPHIIQIGPQNMEIYHYEPNEDDDGRGPELHKFAMAGLKELAFPDYHEDFPHKPWTIGFTGRPGGPDIYINKMDNSRDHGPGGQYQHALREQGDPCFAKIVEGQEHLAMAYQQPIYGDESQWHYFFHDPIEIVQARVLNSAQPIPQSMLTEQQPQHYQHHAGDDEHREPLKPQMPKNEYLAEA